MDNSVITIIVIILIVIIIAIAFATIIIKFNGKTTGGGRLTEDIWNYINMCEREYINLCDSVKNIALNDFDNYVTVKAKLDNYIEVDKLKQMDDMIITLDSMLYDSYNTDIQNRIENLVPKIIKLEAEYISCFYFTKAVMDLYINRQQFNVHAGRTFGDLNIIVRDIEGKCDKYIEGRKYVKAIALELVI